MLMMPSSAEQANQLMFLIPALVSAIVLISMPSALGLYWATSNIASVIQSIMVKQFIKQQESQLTIN